MLPSATFARMINAISAACNDPLAFCSGHTARRLKTMPASLLDLLFDVSDRLDKADRRVGTGAGRQTTREAP